MTSMIDVIVGTPQVPSHTPTHPQKHARARARHPSSCPLSWLVILRQVPERQRSFQSLGTFCLSFLSSSLTLYIIEAVSSCKFGFCLRARTISNSDVTFVTIFDTDEKCSFRRSQKVCRTHSIVLSMHTLELNCSFACSRIVCACVTTHIAMREKPSSGMRCAHMHASGRAMQSCRATTKHVQSAQPSPSSSLQSPSSVGRPPRGTASLCFETQTQS